MCIFLYSEGNESSNQVKQLDVKEFAHDSKEVQVKLQILKLFSIELFVL